jgi:hypothetical protein
MKRDRPTSVKEAASDPLRVFIASSNNARHYVDAIKYEIENRLKNEVACFPWYEGGVFEDGRAFLETLEQIPSQYDCGIAVFTADDKLGGRTAPRDNVVLEFGLFLGAFGRARSFLLVEDKPLKIPSDYAGITTSRFPPKSKDAPWKEVCSAVSKACLPVVDRLKKIERHRQPEALRRLEHNWRSNYPGENFKLFSFYGLREATELMHGSGEEEVYYLWADPRGDSWVRAEARDERARGKRSEHLLRVDFKNAPGSYPGNIAVRLKHRAVVSAAPQRFRRLSFCARVPARAGAVYVGIRIVDALATHWAHGRTTGEYSLETVKPGGEWQDFEIALEGPHWWVFASDGNYLYHDKKPDFSQILVIVAEVGGSRENGRPGRGGGVIEFKDFRVE